MGGSSKLDKLKAMQKEGKKGIVCSRRPVVRRRLHAIDATRVHQTRSWVVPFSSLRLFGPRRATAILRAGHGDDAYFN